MAAYNTIYKYDEPITDILDQMGCNPQPMDNIGYTFQYSGYQGLYVPRTPGKDIVRFVFPKLARVYQDSKDSFMERLNMANSIVTESKFTVMENEVWLIFERFISGNEDYPTIIAHILENLKSGTELFHKFFRKSQF